MEVEKIKRSIYQDIFQMEISLDNNKFILLKLKMPNQRKERKNLQTTLLTIENQNFLLRVLLKPLNISRRSTNKMIKKT